MSGGLCGDCPPIGYPTDKTRCLPCPRRTPKELDAIVDKMAADVAARQPIEALVVAAQEAARTFDAYARHHAAKTPPDADKAARNRERAGALRAALVPYSSD